MVDGEAFIHPVGGHCATAIVLDLGAHDCATVVTEVVLDGWGGHLWRDQDESASDVAATTITNSVIMCHWWPQ